MKQVIINAHVVDEKNVGDLVSSPIRYFEFPGFEKKTIDIRAFDTEDLQDLLPATEQVRYHLVVGGGGLIYQRFLRAMTRLGDPSTPIQGARVLWGIGQQDYGSNAQQGNLVNILRQTSQRFNYQPYLAGFDLIGLRDDESGQAWVPCASCMHPAFDQPYRIEHEFVVFSHKKFQIHVDRLPRMTNESNDLASILAFLGSGETVLTSSYHGAYWGLLLGRKVLAFPFSTKFMTLKHKPGYYPLQSWRDQIWKFRPFREGFLNKLSFKLRYGNKYSCTTEGWQAALKDCQIYPDILSVYRSCNLAFYQQVMATFAARS